MTTRVERFGLLAPTEGAEVVRDQIRAAARYYNDLIALERTRRAVYREIRRTVCPEIDEAEQRINEMATELEAARQVLLTARKDARGRVVDREAEAHAKKIRIRLRAARAALKLQRKEASENEELRMRVRELEERGSRWHKALRATTEAYWGTYLLAEQSYDQARKSLVDPIFRRARGFERVRGDGTGSSEGRIGVQIQGGMTAAELFSCEDTRARLEVVPDRFGRPRSPATASERRSVYARLWLRVGSEGRAPVWAVFPLRLHRPLPADAQIKLIVVRLRVVAFREEWSACITCTSEAVPMPQHGGAVALDLGWRKRPGRAGLRVAYWVDDQGKHGEILAPHVIRERLRKANDLRSIQDTYFNRMRHALARWLRAAESSGVSVPGWMRGECTALEQWRAHGRLRRLVVQWRANRFDRDARIFARLEHWLHRSRHLYEWECEARENALLQRRDIYRTTAAQLARRYGTVVVERFDLRQAKRLHAPEEEEDAPKAQRVQLHHAAPGELRATIRQAVEREGGVVAELDAAGSTSHCHACGGVCTWEQGEELWHRCEHCGELWDQDRNAAINLLRAWTRERSDAVEGGGGARKPNKRAARFSKRHKGQVAGDGAAE